MNNQFSRRQLVKSLSALGALSLTPGGVLMAAAPTKKLGVALVGLGNYSETILAPALELTQHCYLAGIVTGTPSKIEKWQKRYSIPDANVYNYDNMHELANNPAIDVVYIVTPTGLHKALTLKGANAGKHVWCEKPMAMNAKECQEMIDTCRKNKVQLTVGYRMQHEPNTQQFVRWAKEKPYGKINEVIAEAGYRDGSTEYHWRADKALGGGAMYDMGVYPLNAARYTLGEEPIAVTAKQETIKPLYKDVDETMWFDLEFASGAIARCCTSYAKQMNHLRANCEKGWYELNPFQSYSGIKGSTSDGKVFKDEIANQQAWQMDNDALAIINKRAPLVPGEEGMRDIQIIESIFASALSGKRVTLV